MPDENEVNHNPPLRLESGTDDSVGFSELMELSYGLDEREFVTLLEVTGIVPPLPAGISEDDVLALGRRAGEAALKRVNRQR